MSSIMLSFNGNAWSIHYRSQNLCTMFFKEQAGVGYDCLLESPCLCVHRQMTNKLNS